MPVQGRSAVEELFKQHLPEIIKELVKLAHDDSRREIQLEAIKLFLAYALEDTPALGGLLDEFPDE